MVPTIDDNTCRNRAQFVQDCMDEIRDTAGGWRAWFAMRLEIRRRTVELALERAAAIAREKAAQEMVFSRRHPE